MQEALQDPDTAQGEQPELSGHRASPFWTGLGKGRQVLQEDNAITDGKGVGPRDLCLARVVDADEAELAVFAASFREVAPAAHLVVFGHQGSTNRRREIIEK